METKPRISIIAAIGKNRVLGKNNQLLWQIPDDLKRFRELTTGHLVIMGRKTFDSIVAMLGGPLPNRTSIVLMRAEEQLPAAAAHESVLVANSLPEAIEKAAALDSDIYIGGGAQIYALALPYTDRLLLTLIDDEKEGDVFFPEYENLFTKVVSDEAREYNGLKYRWVELQK